jgi:hypothetical protein
LPSVANGQRDTGARQPRSAVGGKDVGLCVVHLDQACLADALTAINQNLPVILSS